MIERYDVRSTILAGTLILFGIVLLVGNLGVPLEPWLGPALLIGLGLVGLFFPKQWAQWRAERDARRAHPHDH